MPRPLHFALTLIGKKGFAFYLVCSLALMLPSTTFWFRPAWPIIGNEFDFWIGQVPGFWLWGAGDWKLLGNLLQSVLFLGAGLGFWASVLEMQENLDKGIKLKIAAKIALVLGIFALGIPWFSVDCFFYLAKGWMETHYGVDIYLTAISEIPEYKQDAFFQNVFPGFLGHLGNYGPLFQYCMKTLAWLGGGDFKLTFLLMRVVFLGALLASAWVVAQLAKRRGLSPVLIVYLFLCNPLVVFNSVTALHNDVVSNLFVLLAIFCAWDRRAFWAGVFLGLGAAWKFIPLLLFPPLTLYFFRSDKKITFFKCFLFLAGLVLSFGLTFLLYPSAFTFFTSVASTGLLTMRSSLALFLVAAFSPFLELWEGFMAAKKIMTVLFLGLSAGLLWPYLTGKRIMKPQVLCFVCFLIFLFYILVGASQVQEWYMTWPLCLGFLLKDGKVRTYCLFLAVFYMPWVNFMCEQTPMAMAVSQVMAYVLFAWVTLRTFAKPLVFATEWREKMLGSKGD